MSCSEVNDAAPAMLRFATAELLEGWLSAADAQDPDLRLRAWRIVARPGIVQVLLRHYEQLPALSKLYLSVKPESMPPVQASETSASHVAQRQAVAPTRSNTAPAALPSGDDLASVADGGIQVGARCRSASQSASGDGVVYVRMEVPPHLLLALVDVFAVVDSDLPSAREYHGSPSAVPPYSQDSPPQDGMTGIVWPLLEVVHGDLEEVSQVCKLCKNRLKKLLVRVPPQFMSERTTRQLLLDALLTLDAIKLEIEICQDKWKSLLSLLVRTHFDF